jgi:competence protein ComGC
MLLFKRNGFTLIEILLVIGVIMIMSIIKIRDINEETEDMQAKMLASQIQTVAEATNAFLVLKYNELSTLSSNGVSCNSGTNTCNITLQNLNDNALLPLILPLIQ